MSLKQLFDLTGKVALITGGSRGLGLQLAHGLGEMGASIVITARKLIELEAAVLELRSTGIDVKAIPSDLSEEAASVELVDSILESHEAIDILINNAAASWAAPAEEYPSSGWRKVMNLNVDGVFYLTREVGSRVFIPQNSGKVINIASVGGLGGNPPQQNALTLGYNTSKGALVNFTKALAVEWGKYNINVNAICPGFFESKMSSVLISNLEKDLLEATPLKRLPGGEDFKGIGLLLASEASRHMTGQVIAVDGGITAY